MLSVYLILLNSSSFLCIWAFWGLLTSSILSLPILDLWLSMVAIMARQQRFLFFHPGSGYKILYQKEKRCDGGRLMH
ncbi:hypothetical protein AHAS_Ahas13G0107000 [Arachis hypogaea]